MRLHVSSSPHIRDPVTTRRLMLDVVIALCPALIASIVYFGYRAAVVVAVAVGSAVLFEFISRRIMKRPQTIGDFSAVITGMLVAFNMPATVPIYLPVIGSLIAIVVVKQMFGGLGQNFVNPALAARIILTISFPAAMTLFVAPATAPGTDLVSSATPLAMLRNQFVPLPDYLDLFLGRGKAGCIGEVCILALLTGAVYLLIRRVITAWIPLFYLATVAIMVAIGGQDPLYHLLSGGLILGAFFMATDYVTSPLTNKGKIIYGLGCGLLTGLIRLFGGMVEGVSFSILLMNILVPHLDRWTRPVQFGGGLKHAKK
ncbi:MAG: RnfABCDGE type electron transport complex subunit D [Saccharofermentanales bacterium]|jgi:electron transport complex protein RnfD|nr:RnfABCDGE type electron transport complex subunit D [Clostridiaceae bacterium]